MSGLLDDDGLDPSSALRGDSSGIEIGRRDTAHRSVLDDGDTTLQLLDDQPLEDMGIDFNDLNDIEEPPPHETTDLGDIAMAGVEDDTIIPGDDGLVAAAPEQERTSRESASLSPVPSDIEQQHDVTFNQDPERMSELDEESIHQQQRAKKRKVLRADVDTQIHGSQIREQQNDRSKILKPASFLPKDPVLLALMEMQKNGSFVSNILGDGRSKGWAPELRGVLSLEVIRQSSGLKRKRDAPGATQDRASPSVRLTSEGAAGTPAADEQREDLDLDDGMLPVDDALLPEDGGLGGADESFLAGGQNEDFDETAMPLLHPNDSGPVSVGTKHAVHLLRARFGPEAENSPGKRQGSSVLFHELLPERSTNRADATKMFFETLVLATKDAIKVEQPGSKLGGPIRMRAKRGLWGAWAEMEAGGEIDGEAASNAVAA